MKEQPVDLLNCFFCPAIYKIAIVARGFPGSKFTRLPGFFYWLEMSHTCPTGRMRRLYFCAVIFYRARYDF